MAVFDTLSNLQQALDMFRASNWLASGVSSNGGYPPMNMFRKGDDYVIVMEVPGVSKADLDLQIRGRTIRIAGTKTADYPEGASRHRRERPAGKFDRSVTLPVEIDAENVKAECNDGVLVLSLPRAARDKPKSIPVS